MFHEECGVRDLIHAVQRLPRCGSRHWEIKELIVVGYDVGEVAVVRAVAGPEPPDTAYSSLVLGIVVTGSRHSFT